MFYSIRKMNAMFQKVFIVQCYCIFYKASFRLVLYLAQLLSFQLGKDFLLL